MNETTNQERTIDISSEHEIRLAKVRALRECGIEPWPAAKEVTSTCKRVIEEYAESAGNVKQYALAGRVMTIRGHGKTCFAHIQDRTGSLQLYIRQDVVGADLFALFEQYIDVGDIIWCYGEPFTTKTGEITLKVIDFALQSKCLYPLPEKFHGLTDIETKYRQRYLDLISNQESRERFKKRSLIIRALRHYFDTHDFLEVETPMLHPIPGGAAARPFITHHNALGTDLYLRIAPELYLKRLEVGGFERVYEINRNFRNEGISTRHNPEFTMVEFYIAYHDFHFMMDFIENMIRTVIKSVQSTLHLPYGERVINFEKPFDRLPMKEAVKKYGPFTDADLHEDVIDEVLKKHGIDIEDSVSYGQKIYALFEELIESKIEQPTFVIDFPIEVSPLSKRNVDNPSIADRCELFIAGMEISNAFNELNDPYDQAERFKQQAAAHASGDLEAMHYDADYIHALEYALPPTVGAGIGIDRLVMLVTNTTSIKDVILFPTLKKKD